MGADPDLSGLRVLAGILTSVALPRPSALVTLLAEAQGYADLCALIQDYLPELRAEILGAGGSGAMVAAFAQRFEERYFPLAPVFQWGEVERLEDLTQGAIPQVFGVDYDNLHEITDQRLGYVLASLLVDFEGQMSPPDRGIRITLLEKAAETLPADWLDRMVSQGFSLEELEFLKGTDYEGALWHARYLCSETGNYFCDALEDDVMGGMMLDWERETVEKLSQEWAEARAIQDRMVKFYKWLEQAPEEHLRRVLRRLRGIPDVPEQQLPLGLTFDD